MPESRASSRDYRIDFFRGIALIILFIDHVPFNVYSYFTPGNFGLSDAAEIFVLVSGVAAAFAYYGRFLEGDRLYASALAWKRSITLYVAHLFGTMAMLGMFAAASIYFAKPEFLNDINIPPIIADPVAGFAGIVSLGHQLGFYNILPMYMVFLLLMPAIMLLAQRNITVALTASFLLYLATATFRLNLPNYPNAGGWYFNPLAWQFLFTIGFVIGVRMKAGEPVPYRTWLAIAAVAYIVIGGVWVVGRWGGSLPDLPLPFVLYGNDKTFLTMNRLLHVLALAYVLAISPLPRLLQRWLTAMNPVVLIGRYGLVGFVSATLISMVGLILRIAFEGDILFDTVFIASGVAVLAGIGACLEVMRKTGARRAARRSAPPPETAPSLQPAE